MKMAKHWYLYANNEFIGHAECCKVRVSNCPAVNFAEHVGVRIVYEPLINRGFNVLFKPTLDTQAFKDKIMRICDDCIFGTLKRDEKTR